MNCPQSHFDSCKFTSTNFILSSINQTFLKRNKIPLTVAQFKIIVKRSKPSFVTITGGRGFERCTNVYDLKDFEKYQTQQEMFI